MDEVGRGGREDLGCLCVLLGLDTAYVLLLTLDNVLTPSSDVTDLCAVVTSVKAGPLDRRRLTLE